MYSLECAFATTAWWLVWLLCHAESRLERTASSNRGNRPGPVGIRRGLDDVPGDPNRGFTVPLRPGGAVIDAPSSGSSWALVGVTLGGLSLIPWLPNRLVTATNGQPFWTARPDLGSLVETFGVWFVGQTSDLSPLLVVMAVVALLGLIAVGLRQVRGPSSGGLLALPLAWTLV